MNPVICSLSQICKGNVNGDQQVDLVVRNTKIRIQHALIGGKAVSVQDSQLILDQNGFKCKITNPNELIKGRFSPKIGDYCVAVIRISKITKKMSTAMAIKLMKCDNFLYFEKHMQGLGIILIPI